ICIGNQRMEAEKQRGYQPVRTFKLSTHGRQMGRSLPLLRSIQRLLRIFGHCASVTVKLNHLSRLLSTKEHRRSRPMAIGWRTRPMNLAVRKFMFSHIPAQAESGKFQRMEAQSQSGIVTEKRCSTVPGTK